MIPKFRSVAIRGRHSGGGTEAFAKSPRERNSEQVLFTGHENFCRSNVTVPLTAIRHPHFQDHETGPGGTVSVPLLFLEVIFHYYFLSPDNSANWIRVLK